MAAPVTAEEEIFNAARRIDAPDARQAFVVSACSGNRALQSRVESLLRVHDRERSFLGSPLVAQRDVHDPALIDGPGTIIGNYKLLEQIGEGGFALVFMAEQQYPVRRMVALKVLKPGTDTRQVVARFLAEQQALALMDHPNIAKILDAGTTDADRPFFVMEI